MSRRHGTLGLGFQVEKQTASNWGGVCEDLETQPYLLGAKCGMGKDEDKGHRVLIMDLYLGAKETGGWEVVRQVVERGSHASFPLIEFLAGFQLHADLLFILDCFRRNVTERSPGNSRFLAEVLWTHPYSW